MSDGLWFDRPARGERALLVHTQFRDQEVSPLAEFQELVAALGLTTVACIEALRPSMDPRFGVGEGKVEAIAAALVDTPADWVLFNCELSPVQERNLEDRLQRRILGRTGLILEIFAHRAETFEGKLQVELAQMRHLSTRLVRGWSHLERQRGGIGVRGGPGEKQLELDRRLIARRIQKLGSRIEAVRLRRGEGRRARERAGLPVVALVGYTNAGKSTLFNALTGAFSFAADQLFATLDPRLRHLQIPQVGRTALTDTVGFIRHLPHELVAAFRATLDEARYATLLVEVIDAADPVWELKHEQVLRVLADIEADAVPRLEVLNKIDLRAELPVATLRDAAGAITRVQLSAATGLGLEAFYQALTERLAPPAAVTQRVRLPASAARLRARLYALKVVLTETAGEGSESLIKVSMEPERLRGLLRKEGLGLEVIEASSDLPALRLGT